MRYLLDTNAVSEPFRPVPSENFLRHMRAHPNSTAMKNSEFNCVPGV